MLAADNMLNALLDESTVTDYRDYNNDHDFSEVLELCGGNTEQRHKIRYSDGQEKYFSFDN